MLSGTSLGVVIHTAMRQATQSVMKYIARKTTKLVYPPRSPNEIRQYVTCCHKSQEPNDKSHLDVPPVELHRMISPTDCHGWRARLPELR